MAEKLNKTNNNHDDYNQQRFQWEIYYMTKDMRESRGGIGGGGEGGESLIAIVSRYAHVISFGLCALVCLQRRKGQQLEVQLSSFRSFFYSLFVSSLFFCPQ